MDIFTTLAAPVSVLALAGLLPLAGRAGGRQWLARLRMGAPDPSARLSSETAVRLGAHHTAHVLRLGHLRWLLVCHPGGATVVERLEHAEPPSNAGSREAPSA